MSGTDYVTFQAKVKNSLLAGQGTYDLGNPPEAGGGELVLISEDQATFLRSWWVNQILTAWDAYKEAHSDISPFLLDRDLQGILPERVQKELAATQDSLAGLDTHSTENGPWLAYDAAVAFWGVTGRAAIQLNSIGVVASVDEVTFDAIGEAIEELPNRIGEAIGDGIVAVGRTAGEALYGLIKGLGFTALIVAGVVAGTIIVLRRVQ